MPGERDTRTRVTNFHFLRVSSEMSRQENRTLGTGFSQDTPLYHILPNPAPVRFVFDLRLSSIQWKPRSLTTPYRLNRQGQLAFSRWKLPEVCLGVILLKSIWRQLLVTSNNIDLINKLLVSFGYQVSRQHVGRSNRQIISERLQPKNSLQS